MENSIIQSLAIGLGGVLVLFCIAYEIVAHETRARIYRTHRLDNWYDKE